MKSALVVDDHPVIRNAVRIILEGLGFKLIHEASSGAEVLPLIRAHKPDIAILDLNLPGMQGLDVLDRIKSSAEHCRVLVYTGLESDQYQTRCMRAGARAYVNKAANLQQLCDAIKAVISGYTYFSESGFPGGVHLPHSNEREQIDKLSHRELEILVHLAHGKANKDIATEINRSHKTISTYKTRLMLKLGMKSKVLLREFAKRNGLI